MCSAAAGKDRVMQAGSTDVAPLTWFAPTRASLFRRAWSLGRDTSVAPSSYEAELVLEPGDLEQPQRGRLRAAQLHRVLRAERLAGPDERTQTGRVDEADLAEIDHQCTHALAQQLV